MLVSFTIDNWMSFRDPVTLSLVAGDETQHRNHIPEIRDFETAVVPVCALLGANGSGKTNFFKALNFVKTMVVEGTDQNEGVDVCPFLLDNGSAEEESTFHIALLIDQSFYEYSFSASCEAGIIEEKLVLENATGLHTLFVRRGNQINLDSALQGSDDLMTVFRNTRSNQLYLNALRETDFELFKPVYSWFDSRLVMLRPDSRFDPFIAFNCEGQHLLSRMSQLLSMLDTGITSLGGKPVPLEQVDFTDCLKGRLYKAVHENWSAIVDTGTNGQIYFVYNYGGSLFAIRLESTHKKPDGTEVVFNLNQESGGVQRLINLLPAFIELMDADCNKVYVIDRFFDSMHTLLKRRLINLFFFNCGPDSRRQLLFTTHDVELLDKELFRTDEIWLAERDEEGASHLDTVFEYRGKKIDKDLRTSYLQGKMGAVPDLPGKGVICKALKED